MAGWDRVPTLQAPQLGQRVAGRAAGEESRVLLNLQLPWLGSHLKAAALQGGLHVGPTCCPVKQWLDPCPQLPACFWVMGDLADEAIEGPANLEGVFLQKLPFFCPFGRHRSQVARQAVHDLLCMLQFLRCIKVDELHLSC